MAVVQPSGGQQILSDFYATLEEYSIPVLDGEAYVHSESLKTWWRVPGRMHTMLDYVYADSNLPRNPITAGEICRENDSCIVVFSILLKIRGIEAAKVIHEYERHEIFDNRLPILIADWIVNHLPFAEEFYEAQRPFCPVILEPHSRRHYTDRVLPICKHRALKKGGTATLWEIAVQQDFIHHRSRKGLTTFEDENFGKCYQFALKRYPHTHEALYKREKAAFRALGKHEGMIQYLGDYEQEVTRVVQDGHRETISTYNILLEYAELDLDAYFQERLSPVLDGELDHFWQDMLEVAKALQTIHDFTTVRGGILTQYYGWHADIKPENILIVREKFKLADLGFSTFEKKNGTEMATFKGGTRTYGPPECYRAAVSKSNRPFQFDQTIDIWSLGCVFSIAATWVVLGYDGIRQFQHFRTAAIENLVQQRNVAQQPSQEETFLAVGDYFHDGNDVLEAIHDWHKFLREHLRRGDRLTAHILDLVDHSMLRGKPQDRKDVAFVCNHLQDLLKKSRLQPREAPSSGILEALLTIDNEASQKPTLSQLSSSLRPAADQKTKSGLLELRKMTAHRSEYLRSELYPDEREEHRKQSHDPTNVTMQANSSAVEDQHLQHNRRVSTFITHITRPDRSLTAFSRPKRENVFQARGAISRSSKSFLGFTTITKKDELLRRYFDNRDIIILVDNAASMADEWDEAMYVVETLAMKVQGLDKNGVDMFFTNGTEKLENCKIPSDLRKKMKEESVRPRPFVYTDPTTSLASIFNKYLDGLRRAPKGISLQKMKKMTLIVCTDGKWEGLDAEGQEEKILDHIAALVEGLKEIASRRDPTNVDKLEKRRVSIEFVQFGDDLQAYAKLVWLDDQLPSHGVEDIVDHELARGDVNKMILGSFIEKWDKFDIPMITDPENQSGPPESIYRADTVSTIRPVSQPRNSVGRNFWK